MRTGDGRRQTREGSATVAAVRDPIVEPVTEQVVRRFNPASRGWRGVGAWVGHRVMSAAVEVAAGGAFANAALLFEEERDARFPGIDRGSRFGLAEAEKVADRTSIDRMPSLEYP